MALTVVLQYLQLCLPLPCPLDCSCCSSVSSVSESVATVGSLLGSFFFLFFFFLLLSALPWSVLLPRSLLGEPVHCFLMGSSVDLSDMRSFLAGVCSPFLGVSFLGVFFVGMSFTGVSLVSVLLGDAFRDRLS